MDRFKLALSPDPKTCNLYLLYCGNPTHKISFVHCLVATFAIYPNDFLFGSVITSPFNSDWVFNSKLARGRAMGSAPAIPPFRGKRFTHVFLST